jgi:hypothetical protein
MRSCFRCLSNSAKLSSSGVGLTGGGVGVTSFTTGGAGLTGSSDTIPFFAQDVIVRSEAPQNAKTAKTIIIFFIILLLPPDLKIYLIQRLVEFKWRLSNYMFLSFYHYYFKNLDLFKFFFFN